MAMSALHLHDGIAAVGGHGAGGNARHCECGRRRGCKRYRDEAGLDKSFHWEISSTAWCGNWHKFPRNILFHTVAGLSTSQVEGATFGRQFVITVFSRIRSPQRNFL
jgi:hypothetical protein